MTRWMNNCLLATCTILGMALEGNSARAQSPTFFDVNGDGWITAVDALAVANQLNGMDFPWQNPVLASDVNGDGFVTSADYDMIADDINANGTRELTGVPDFPTFFDVNGDGWITAADALAAANYLNGMDFPWQNPVLASDVNGDGFVTGADYDIIVDDINANGARQLTGVP